MKATLSILCIFTFFLPIIIASESDWMGRYPDIEKSRLLAVLTKEFDDWQAELHSRESVGFISDNKNIVAVQDVLKDTSKSPLEMYSFLIETLHPEFAELSKDYYKEQRDSSKVSDEFCEFDAKFYKGLSVLTGLLFHEIDWDKHKDHSSKEEVMCEAAFFFGLIDFERAITCLDAAPPVPLTCKIFSYFVADMYLGEAKRQDFSYEGDIETRKWLDDMVKKYRAGWYHHTTSLMRRFTRDIRDKVDDKLWKDYMRAMMTAHLSAVLLSISEKRLKDLYEYIADNHIQDEFMFASKKSGPLRPGQDRRKSHAFLRTFKLDPSGETATMGIINSGAGIRFHDYEEFNLSALPDTISKSPHAESVYRFIPFAVYDKVPRRDWGPAYTITDSMKKAYFEHKQKTHEFSDYEEWQYIDSQRTGTCTVMSLWSGLYWFERESQQKLESFRLGLYLEVLKMAAKELFKLRTELEDLDTLKLESADDEHKWNELQSKIRTYSEEEGDYLRFFSVGFNSAIRSIRYLHDDPFQQGLNMTAVMQDYADFYESQASEKYWQFVKPNIDDLFHSTYLRVIKPMIWITPLNVPKISVKERGCVNEVNQAIESDDPFSFVKVVIGGTDLKCQGKEFLASIHSGISTLDLQTHHQDLILRALAKEIRSLSGGRLSILRLIQQLINDYDFKLFPIYDVPPNTKTNFIDESRQVFIFDDDAEMKQFAVNCGAFELLGKNVLAAAYDLVKSTRKALPDLVIRINIATTEEYKLHESLVESAATELQSIDPHLYVQYFGSLIWNAEETGIDSHIGIFKPSTKWTRDDYEFLERATRGSGSPGSFIKEYLDYFYNLTVGRELASKHLPSLPSNLSKSEYICAGAVSRVIDVDSPLEFVKTVISGVDGGCKSELFFSSIIDGIDALELQPHHRDLILRAFIWHKNVSQTLEFVDRLIIKYDFNLFSIDNTPPTTKSYTIDSFFYASSNLRNENGAKRFVADLNKDKSNASIILTLCTEHSDLTKLRPHFVERVFKELGAMNPHLHAYHLSRLIRGSNLKAVELKSSGFKPLKEWNDYDYVLIESALIANPQCTEYNEIFKFPRQYHIIVGNVRDGSKFKQMGINVPDETLRECARLLPEKIVENNRGWLSRLRGLIRKI